VEIPRGHGFGTAPVFLASICTILGAILFLRFGWAVGQTGLHGTILIVLIGHLVTVPTALAISEIATNRRVEGGGGYFIISRSFGSSIGGAIGISLFLSQGVSVAFYLIAFAEAFQPFAPWFEETMGLPFDARWVSLPSSLLLVGLVLTRGANLGIKALWVVASILAVSLIMFFVGQPTPAAQVDPTTSPFSKVQDAEPFVYVFAIVFPAFTGIIAGLGLSGDLENPRRSIPLGILTSTAVGMIVYLVLAWKLWSSATLDELAGDQLIMQRIAVWGPIVPIGLGCATLSSAIGSILVAPRTLQALGLDRALFSDRFGKWVEVGLGDANEPRNASLVTGILTIVTVALGNVDVVARIISMFFMVTYGALCAISFLEHFAARPSYRPSFRSKWWISLLGAISCLMMMFQMDPFYALVSIVIMVSLYMGIRSSRKDKTDDLAAIFQGVMTQATRYMQIKLQKSLAFGTRGDWRPSVIMVNGRTFDRSAPMQFLTWVCHRYGFGTYLHLIRGDLSNETFWESRNVKTRLIETVQSRKSSIYVDTLISTSMHEALSQSLQVPGISGMENNTVLFEFSNHDGETELEEVRDGCLLAEVSTMSSLVLRHGDHYFGNMRTIHIWITWHDYRNATLMILLAYILLGHPDWNHGEISIFAAFPREEQKAQTQKLREMIATGRLPISRKNVRLIPTDGPVDFDEMVTSRSKHADLVILGFTRARLEDKGTELFTRHPALNEVLFVSAQQRVVIE
jgi:amino acid transporter